MQDAVALDLARRLASAERRLSDLEAEKAACSIQLERLSAENGRLLMMAEQRAKEQEEWDALTPEQQAFVRAERLKEEEEAEKRARRTHSAMRASTRKLHDDAGWEMGTAVAEKVDLSNRQAAGDKKKEIEV